MTFSYPLAVIFTLFITFCLFDKRKPFLFLVKDFSLIFIFLSIRGHLLVGLYKENCLPANPYLLTLLWFSNALFFSIIMLALRIYKYIKNLLFKRNIQQYIKNRPSITISRSDFQKFSDKARDLVFKYIQDGDIKISFYMSKTSWNVKEKLLREELEREIFNKGTTAILSFDILNNFLRRSYPARSYIQDIRKLYILSLMYVIFIDEDNTLS